MVKVSFTWKGQKMVLRDDAPDIPSEEARELVLEEYIFTFYRPLKEGE